MVKEVYQLTSEGKVIHGFEDDSQIYCGEVYIDLVEVEVDDEDPNDQDYWEHVGTLEGFIDCELIEDKWGASNDPKPRKIEGVWDSGELDVEFTNGTIHLGYFNTLEEAQKVMNNQFEGSVNVMDLERE